MTLVLLGAGTLFWRVKQIENSSHSEVPDSANVKSVPPDCLSRQAPVWEPNVKVSISVI